MVRVVGMWSTYFPYWSLHFFIAALGKAFVTDAVHCRGARPIRASAFRARLCATALVAFLFAFVQSSSWMVTGWELLRQEAAFEIDYLLPSPTDGFRGWRRKELKYVIGSAVQFRVLSILKVDGKWLFSHKVAQHWTPHSGRNYLPKGRQGPPRSVVRQSQCP